MPKRVIKEDDDVEELMDKAEKQTTYLNDYRKPKIVPELEKGYSKKIKDTVSGKKRTAVDKTSGPKVPFDFYLRPKPILQPFKMITDAAKAHQFTQIDEKEKLNRPRIYRSNEVSLDDIPDKELRDKIIKFAYTSETQHSLEDTLKEKLKMEERNGIQPPISIEKSLGVVIEPQTLPTYKRIINPKYTLNPTDCESDACYEWETKQPVYHEDPNQVFSLKHEVHESENLVSSDIPDKAAKLLKENRLRYPHMINDLNYTAYKPRNTSHIGLEKIQFEPQDFWFTTNQYYGKHYLSTK